MTRKRGGDAPTRIRNQFGHFAQIPEDLVTDPSISDRAIRVYALLWVYSNKEDLEAFPSRNTMASDLDVSKATIDRGVGELVRRGAITVEETFAGDRQTSNLYTIIAPLPPRPEASEVIHRGRKFEAPPASNLEPPGASNLRLQEQEPEEQEIYGPVPEVTTDDAVDNSGTGPSITPATFSHTHRQPLHPPSIFASVGKMLPPSFDDEQLLELCREILDQSSARVVEDPTAYVIRSIRNTVRHIERDRGKWLLRADEIAVEHLELGLREGARF